MAEFDGDTTGNRTPSPVAEPSSRPHVEIGEIIDERYKVISFLGEGGMAMVFQIERLFFKDTCAMKLGRHTLSQVSGQRFRNEAIAACSLEHPNLLRIYDFGIVKEQYPYFVMDFVDGETLHDYLERNGTLSLRLAMEIFGQVCDGMAHAHRKGIVHRDLKPGNIMLIERPDAPPIVKVLDFGLAKLLEDASDQSLTRPGEVFGSPLYMSPEQCGGTDVDHRSDIYSFGCMLFQALTGRVPFQGNSSVQTLMQHREKTPPRLRKASGGTKFPDELEALVAQLLSKNPNDRPSKFEDVHALLKQACHQSAPLAVTGITPAESSSATPLRLKTKLLWVAGLSSFVIVGTALCLLAMEFAIPTREGTVSPQCARFGSPFKFRDDEVSQQPYKVHYFSKIVENDGTKEKQFIFPPGMFLGRLYIIEPEFKRPTGWRAENSVTTPYGKPLGLQVLGDTVNDTRLLRSFRKSDLEEVLFLKAFVSNACIDDIAHLSDLRGLEFEITELTDAALPRIETLFPKLERLTLVGSPSLTADAIANMKIIHRLVNLKISGVTNGGIVVRKLITEAQRSHNSRIYFLAATDLGLIDDDLANIENLPELITLQIRKNPTLTDKALQHLVKCKKLRNLDLRDMNVTPQSAKILKGIKSLKHLELNPHGWTKEQRRAFIHSLPGVFVEFRQQDPKDVNVPDSLHKLNLDS